MTKVAVILSGCGHQDGTEIREAVLSLLYLDQEGAQVSIFAPDIQQASVVDHIRHQPTDEMRNVLIEAARIARGNISGLSKLNVAQFDALVMPGGYGAAKNLSDFASKGKDCRVLPELQNIIQQFAKQKKPIGAICIAPAVLVAAMKGVATPKVTIGDNADVAAAIEAMGGKHVNCPTRDCVVDDTNQIVTCSAYMRDDQLAHIGEGIQKTVRQVLSWAKINEGKAAA